MEIDRDELLSLRKQLKGALTVIDRVLGPEKVQRKRKEPLTWASAAARDANVPGLDLEAWGAWLRYRRDLLGEKPYKTTAQATKLVRLASECQCAQGDIVQQSIENEWRGLFELKRGFKPRADDEPERELL